MAEAAFATNSETNKNFYRFHKLIFRAGTVIVRGLFDSIHKPSDLPQKLQRYQHTLRSVSINHSEWKKLYPSNITYGESKDFDLSLLIKLLRNICNLNSVSPSWSSPNEADHSLEADLARVRDKRNIIAHPPDTELSDYDFKQFWDQIQEALLRIRGHYSQRDVDDWRKGIEEYRTKEITNEEIKEGIKEWINQLQELTIRCMIEVRGYVGNATALLWGQFQDNIQQLLVVIQDVISPTRDIIAQGVYYSSINIQLRVKNAKALEEFWQRYQSGELASELEKVLITDQIRKHGDCQMTVTIPEEQYLDAQAFFDELAQHLAIVESTETFGALSLAIVHGKPTVVRGNKFQAHLAEIATKDEIDDIIKHMKEDPKYKGTTDFVWAYKYKHDDGQFIYDSDDGGDEFLAGRRLQILLEKMAVKSVLVIVTCWQGDEYLYLDIFKHINERALELLITEGLTQEGIYQEDVPFIVKKLEDEFEQKKQKLALKAFKVAQQATGRGEEEPTDFKIIHSEVITDRKSTFQAHLAHVISENQVEQVLEELKKEGKIAKATYNMLAYRIYVKEKKSYLEDGRDDGENEAGKRLLHLLETSKVENAVVIVTRWHGGIHIGTDRFKHINACASQVIKMARDRGLISDGQEEEPRMRGSMESKQKTKGKGKPKSR